jgi:hypothetical protein
MESRASFSVAVWGAFVEDHDDIGAQVVLDLHGGFGVDEYLAAVDGGAEGDAFFGDLAQFPQTEDLKAAGVGQDWSLPLHEVVQVAVGFDHFGTRTEHEVEGVAEDDLGADCFDIPWEDGLYCAVGSNGHECGCFDGASWEFEASTAGLAVGGVEFELHEAGTGH